MSDGPHRTLPLKGHWKSVAKKAEELANSTSDVAEAWDIGMEKDFRELPNLRKCLKLLSDSSIFPEVKLSSLEDLKKSCYGSKLGFLLVNQAIDACKNGLTGREAAEMALRNTYDAHSGDIFRQQKEHYLRKDPKNKYDIENRFNSALLLCSKDPMISRLISGKPMPKKRSKDRSLDGGVEL